MLIFPKGLHAQFPLKRVVMGHQDQLVQAGRLPGLDDGICKFLAAIRIDRVGWLIKNAETQSAEFLYHSQRHRQRELGLFAAGQHGKTAVAGRDP